MTSAFRLQLVPSADETHLEFWCYWQTKCTSALVAQAFVTCTYSASCRIANRFPNGDDKPPYETNAISEGSNDTNTKRLIGNRRVKKEEKGRWNTRAERNGIQKQRRKLRSSLSLPVDAGFSRLTRVSKKTKTEPRET